TIAAMNQRTRRWYQAARAPLRALFAFVTDDVGVLLAAIVPALALRGVAVRSVVARGKGTAQLDALPGDLGGGARDLARDDERSGVRTIHHARRYAMAPATERESRRGWT